jgi:hypothetical protein
MATGKLHTSITQLPPPTELSLGSGLDETARGRAEGSYMPTMTREAKLKVAGHFCGRITCWIWRWFGHRLWRFERWVARGIMHRATGGITFGR